MSLLSGCERSVDNDFALSLTLTSQENSADSNSQTETLDLNSTRGEYTWTYDGYHPSDDFEREKKEHFELTTEQVQSLKFFLTSQGLAQDLKEEAATGELGSSVTMSLELEMAGEKTRIDISGMSAIYGDGNGASNMENFETVEAAQELISTVKDLAGLYED